MGECRRLSALEFSMLVPPLRPRCLLVGPLHLDHAPLLGLQNLGLHSHNLLQCRWLLGLLNIVVIIVVVAVPSVGHLKEVAIYGLTCCDK